MKIVQSGKNLKRYWDAYDINCIESEENLGVNQDTVIWKSMSGCHIL